MNRICDVMRLFFASTCWVLACLLWFGDGAMADDAQTAEALASHRDGDGRWPWRCDMAMAWLLATGYCRWLMAAAMRRNATMVGPEAGRGAPAAGVCDSTPSSLRFYFAIDLTAFLSSLHFYFAIGLTLDGSKDAPAAGFGTTAAAPSSPGGGGGGSSGRDSTSAPAAGSRRV